MAKPRALRPRSPEPARRRSCGRRPPRGADPAQRLVCRRRPQHHRRRAAPPRRHPRSPAHAHHADVRQAREQSEVAHIGGALPADARIAAWPPLVRAGNPPGLETRGQDRASGRRRQHAEISGTLRGARCADKASEIGAHFVASATLRAGQRPPRDAMHSISISIAGSGRAWTTHVVRAGYGGGPKAPAYKAFIAATSDARVSSTLTLTRSRKPAPASSRTRLMLRTTKPNWASKPSARAPFSSKPGMPETNSRSPTRVANDSGGAFRPAGGAKCWMGAMGPLLRWRGRA